MLSVNRVSVSFGGELLFDDISFRLTPGDRVGLIGKNGAGKSTMLRILAKDQEASAGEVALEKERQIGFLRQDIDFVHGRTVLEEAYEAFVDIKKLEIRLEKINQQLAERTDYESDAYHQLMVDLNEVTHRYEILGGYNYQGDTEKVLQGLGFKREDFNKLTDTFSGGWRMRIELAKLLLQKNDILLLDEPTNHLDIESIIWLEQFLKSFPGVIVIVSHDKMFLDNVTNRTIEISLGRIYDYNKPYTQFLQLRQEIREQQLATKKNQDKHIEHTEKLIEKFRAKASKATMAQSLIKKLERMERMEVDEQDNAVMNVRFQISVQPGKVVLEGKNLSKNYGDKEVLNQVDLLVERGSKIAFVGQNGQGKTTLAKMIISEIPFNGDLKLGHNVQVGYFAQNQAEYLDGKKTVEETIIDAANENNRTQVRDILGSFLFRGDEVEKKVKVLSGGERNRLALAKLMLQPFNVLIMDEPTNHLDIQSKNVLKKALQGFEGTLILVSHDREFLQGLTNKVYEFKDHKVKEYLGDINFYLEQRNLEYLRDIEKTEKEASTKKNSGNQSYEQQKQVKKIKNRLSKTETQISDLEREIAEIDVELTINYDALVAQPDFFDNYQSKKDQLAALMDRWETLHLELEGLETS